MVIPDTSAWIEFLRGTGSPTALTVRRLLNERAPIATTEHIVFEVLAGARTYRELNDLRSELLGFHVLTLEGMDDFEEAARLHLRCRLAGTTIRSLTDCLIAVPVIRAGAELLHRNRDFDVIAQQSALRIYPWDSSN